MRRLSPEQRLLIVETYFQNQCSVVNCFRALRQHFGRHNRPTERTIRKTITKFRTNSTLLDIRPTTRVRRARNIENIAAVAESIRLAPEQSIRQRSKSLGISYGSLCRILKSDLVKKETQEDLTINAQDELSPEVVRSAAHGSKLPVKSLNKCIANITKIALQPAQPAIRHASPSKANKRKQAPTDVLCDVCKRSGTGRNLVLCDECRKNYHFTCLDPPLKTSPKRRGYSWHCANCDQTDVETT